jgi:hypothetical protein
VSAVVAGCAQLTSLNLSEEDEEEDEVEGEEEGEEEEITVTLGDGRLGIDFVWPYIEKVDPVRFCSL